MQKNHIGKIFAIGITVLFIGACIYIVCAIITTDDGIWEKIEYGEYPDQEPCGLGNYYYSANCSIGAEASYITKEINLNGLTLATIGFSYYFGGHGTAIVNVYSGGYGMNFWEEAIFLFTSSNSPHTDNYESTIYPYMYSYPGNVYLEFYYFNDYGQSPPGFSIDDISITEIGYFNSFEICNGSLSGYVNDTHMNPISGARVRVSFHGTYEEDYTDYLGYYHVTNIPICWCMKNCTASKQRYSTEEVWLSIDEDTTYDFALSCISMQVDANGPYFGWNNELIQFFGLAYCGSEPYYWHWYFGDGFESNEQNPNHSYVTPGNYTVVLIVEDAEDNIDQDTTWSLIVDCPIPPTPSISGPKSGKPGIVYDYTFNCSNPSGTEYFLFIHWGDGTEEAWIGPYGDDISMTVKHSWAKKGIFIIKAKSKNFCGDSEWGTLDVNIPRNRVWLRFPDIFPILQRILELIK